MPNFLKKMFTGRMNRKQFLLPGILLLLLTVFFPFGVNVIDDYVSKYIQPSLNGGEPLIFLLSLSFLFYSIFFLPIVVKRLHDIGLSGWFGTLTLYQLIIWPIVVFEYKPFLFPLLALFAINILFLFFLFIMPGKKETNQYGEVPPGNKKRYILFFFNLIFMALTVLYFWYFIASQFLTTVSPIETNLVNIPVPNVE